MTAAPIDTPPSGPSSHSPSPPATPPRLDRLAKQFEAMSAGAASPPPSEADSEASSVPLPLSDDISQPVPPTDGVSEQHAARPSTPRSQTDSSLDLFPTHHPRPRNRSPYSRTHLRSHSSSSSLSAPPMMRAHSLPTVMSSSSHLSLSPSPMPLARPSSPLRSPKRTRSPFRNTEEQYIHSGAPSVCDISEDAELELTPKAGNTVSYGQHVPTSPFTNMHNPTNSLPRMSRRRPASPLHQVSVPFGVSASNPVSTPTSATSSPLLGAAKYNEPFPGSSVHYPSSLASSSVPSTPTSLRSRSPSISSLETIPDSPDAEAEAVEADRIARLKAAEDKEKDGGDKTDFLRRTSLDVPGSGRTLGFGKRDSRKRWSVCGAERRGDLDLETIWED